MRLVEVGPAERTSQPEPRGNGVQPPDTVRPEPATKKPRLVEVGAARKKPKLVPVDEPVGAGEAIGAAVESTPDVFKRNVGGLMRLAGERSEQDFARERAMTPEQRQERRDLSQAAEMGFVTETPRVPEEGEKNWLTEKGKAVADEARKSIQENMPPLEPGTTPYYLYHGTTSVGQMAPAVIGTVLTGNPAVGAALFAPVIAGTEYDEARREGRTVDQATMDSTVKTAAESLSEMLPLGTLTKRGGKYLWRVGKSGLSEGIQETVNEGFNMLYDYGVIGEKTSPEDIKRRLTDAFVIGAGVGTTFGIPSHMLTSEQDGTPAGEPDGQPDITATPEESIEDIDATGGDASTIETADDLAETETGVVEDVALTGEDALAQQVEAEFGDQPIPGSEQDELIDLSGPVEKAEPLPTADVVAMAPDEEIVMEGPADPDFSDYAERQGLTPPERQRTIQALEKELEPAPVSQEISPSQAPQTADIAVQAESQQDLPQVTEFREQAKDFPDSDPISVAMRAATDEGATYESLGELRTKVRPTEKALMQKYGVKKVTELEDAPLTESERNFLYYDDTPSDFSSIDAMREMIEPVENLADAKTELTRVARRLPETADTESMSQTDKLAVGRLMYLGSEIQRLGGDARDVLYGTVLSEASRHRDPEDADFMARDMAKRLGQFVNLPKQVKGADKAPALESPSQAPAERPAPKAETKPAPSEKSAPQTAQTDLTGKYVRSGSTTGKVTAVSEDGKKATLDSGRRVPVGRAKNWTVQDEPFDGAKKRAAKAKQEPQKKAAKEPAKASEKPAESKPKSEKQADTKAARKTGQGMLATAYHGSPHKFDRFDISSIGTGQGAQTFGHGIYIAENKKVADSYRMALSRRNMMTSDSDRLESLEVDGERLVDQYPIEVDSEFLDLIDDQDRILAYRHARERIKRWKELSADESYPFRDYAAEKADAWERLAPRIRAGEIDNPSLGNLYTADIPDSAVSKMLDWDKPLSEQPEVVQDAYRNLGLAEEALSVVPTEGAKWVDIPGMPGGGGYAATVDGRTISNAVHKQPGQAVLAAKQAIARDYPQDGQQMYRWLSQKMGSDEQAARALRDAGIPGIKYLDQGSRTQGEGTRNFVIFDDSLITILERNGEPVTGAERDQVLASMRSEPARGMSPTEAREQLESRFGKKAIRKLEKSGRFTILNSPDQLDTRVRRRLFGENVTASPSGLYDPKSGKSWLFTDNIGSGDAVGVFLHEVGAHYGLKRMIGAKEYTNVKKRLRDLANDGDVRVREAIFRVPEDTADQYFWDEVLAYLVQHNYRFNDVPSANRAAMKDKLVRALRKVVAQIRAFLNELGFLNTKNLTADDIVVLVQGAARHAARTAPQTASEGATMAPMASKERGDRSDTPQPRERSDAKVKQLQQELKSVESKFDALRQRREFGDKWEAVEQEAAAIRRQLLELTGDPYGITSREPKYRPTSEELNAEYQSPDDVPKRLMEWLQKNNQILFSDATDAVRWARIVDTLGDERYDSGSITIYRAVSDGGEIRPGDWITTDRKYAEEHLSKSLDGEGSILEETVDGEDVLVSPTGNSEEAIYAPKELSGPVESFDESAPDTGALFSKATTPEQKRERLRRMGLDFEDLPGDLEGNQTRATEPVDQEPETVDTETARENLKKRDFGGPMFSVDQEAQDRGTVAHMVTGEERPTFHPSTQQQNKLKKFIKRFFSKEGLLTDEAFQRHIESMGIKNEDELVAQFMVDGMVKAAQQAYGRPWSKISDRDKAQMNEYLAGNNQAEVPARAKAELDNLRTSLDNLSGRTQQMLIDEITYRLYALSPEKREAAMALIRKRDQELTEADFEGVDPIVARKVMMYRTIEGNKRQYLNRSYAVFDNDKWASEVEPEVVERARQYLRRQVDEDAKLSQMSDNAKTDYVEGVINKILNPKGKDMMSFMNSDQLGQKDLSIMKRRKDIAPEIRELMGEYTDPRLNYTRSLAKMSYLVANHHFLRSVREDGLGVFLSAKPSGRMHEEITSWDDNTMAPLAGLYASPEFSSALRDAIQPRVLEGWLRSLLMMNAGVKYGKTVLSPTTMARNFYSAAMFTVLNGHFNWRHAVKAGSHTWADLGSSNPKKMDYLRKLVGMGVLHDNPRARELQEAMNEAANMNELEGSLPARGLKTALNAATKMYRAGDDFWKIIGFENEKANLMKHGMPEAEAEAMAADRIRNGYPTYSMVPKAIQLLRRFPMVGTFVAFPWEIMRTTRHQFRMMNEDRKAGRKDMFAKRAVGMAIAGGLAHGISKATMAWMGLDDEDDEAVRQMAPEWQENAQLAYLGYGDNGHLRYLDLSHLDPYTYLKVPFIALANGNYDTVDQSVAAAMRDFLEPFLGTEIGFGAFMDVWNNTSDYGPVYDEHADSWIKGKQVFEHLREEMQPGMFSNMERTLKAWHGEYASYGRKYDLGDEALAWVGFRTTTMDPEISLRFRSFEFNDQKSDASQPTYRAFRDPNIGAYKDIPDAVKRSRSQWRAAFKDMHASIRASRSIGMEDRDIKDALLWGGVAKKYIPYLLKGRTPPWRPYKPTLENARESIIRTRDDPQEKRALMQDFKKRRETLYQQLSQ